MAIAKKKIRYVAIYSVYVPVANNLKASLFLDIGLIGMPEIVSISPNRCDITPAKKPIIISMGSSGDKKVKFVEVSHSLYLSIEK